MTPWLVYSIIILVLGLFFWLSMRAQNNNQAKRWLIKKIKQDSEQKDAYIEALNKLDNNPSHISKVTVLMFVLMLPAALLLNVYLFPEVKQEAQQPPSIEEALVQLEQALQENPNDLQGQILYARAMMSMQNFEPAVKALRKANDISPNDPNILTELAEAVAFNNNTGSFKGEPEGFIDEALAVAPNHQKALWLKGIIAFENQQYAEAEQLWTTLIRIISDDKVKATIVKQINQARNQQGKASLSQLDLENTATSTQSELVTRRYQVTVTADEHIKNLDLSASTRVFISAKAKSGPPMPVAAINLSPPFIWPITVELSDQHNLTPDRHLSDFEELIISARLSLTGDAGTSEYVSDNQITEADETQITVHLRAQ